MSFKSCYLDFKSSYPLCLFLFLSCINFVFKVFALFYCFYFCETFLLFEGFHSVLYSIQLDFCARSACVQKVYPVNELFVL